MTIKYTILPEKTYSMIPARSGSKGIPGKNIKALCGYPLIAYSIKVSLLSRGIDRTIVSTDSGVYAEIARSFGAETPFLRPVNLAADASTDNECLLHYLNWLQEHEGGVPEFIVHLRPTTPVRDPTLVDEAILTLRTNSHATALCSAHEMGESAYKCVEIEDGRYKLMNDGGFDIDGINSPRQSFPTTYTLNGYVDVLKSEVFLGSGKLHADRVIPFITPPAIEIDNLEEFEYLESYLRLLRPSYVSRLFEEEM